MSISEERVLSAGQSVLQLVKDGSKVTLVDQHHDAETEQCKLALSLLLWLSRLSRTRHPHPTGSVGALGSNSAVSLFFSSLLPAFNGLTKRERKKKVDFEPAPPSGSSQPGQLLA